MSRIDQKITIELKASKSIPTILKQPKNQICRQILAKKIPVQIISENKIETMYFQPNTALSIVKNKALNRVGLDENQGYLKSFDKNNSIDYMIFEGLGILTKPLYLCFSANQPALKQQNNLNAYQIGECISVGGFSKVFLLRSKKNGFFYIGKFVDKQMSNDPKFLDLIYNEKSINQALDYPFLVKMHNFIQTRNFYIFVLDYCPSGQLFTLMKNHRDMNQSEAKFYFIQTVLAINYMHSKGIVYRDIKPENILLDKNGHIRLADFGLAKVVKGKAYSYCGSLQYMAPQIITGEAHSFAVDYYCLGSLLYEMMVGCPPFYNPNFTPDETKMHIVRAQVKFPSNKRFTPQFIDFVLKLLEKDQDIRLGSMGGFKQILAHPWIGKLKFKDYETLSINPPFSIPLDQSNFEKTYLPHSEIKEITKKIFGDLQIQKRRSKTISRKRLKSSQDISTSNYIQSKQKYFRPQFMKSRLQKSVVKSLSQSICKAKSLTRTNKESKKQLKTQSDDKKDYQMYRKSGTNFNEYKKVIRQSIQKRKLNNKQNQMRNKFNNKALNLKKIFGVRTINIKQDQKPIRNSYINGT